MPCNNQDNNYIQVKSNTYHQTCPQEAKKYFTIILALLVLIFIAILYK